VNVASRDQDQSPPGGAPELKGLDPMQTNLLLGANQEV